MHSVKWQVKWHHIILIRVIEPSFIVGLDLVLFLSISFAGVNISHFKRLHISPGLKQLVYCPDRKLVLIFYKWFYQIIQCSFFRYIYTLYIRKMCKRFTLKERMGAVQGGWVFRNYIWNQYGWRRNAIICCRNEHLMRSLGCPVLTNERIWYIWIWMNCR